jgi:hypothetical protein
MLLGLTTACRRGSAGMPDNLPSGHHGLCYLRHHRRKCVGWAVLIGYLLFLVCQVPPWDPGDLREGTGLAGLQDARPFVGWVVELALNVCWEMISYAALGFLAAMTVLPRSRSDRRRLVSVGRRVLVVCSALTALTYAVGSASARHLVGWGDLVCPLLGCLFGAWAGTTWLRGGRTRLWFLPKVVISVLLGALGTGLLLWLSLEERPLPFEGTRATSAAKRRLVHLAESLNEGQAHIVRLTERDVNALLSWGLSLGRTDRKAQVQLERERVALVISARIPLGGGRPRYLNLEAAGGAKINDGVLNLRADWCKIGSRRISPWLLQGFCALAASQLNRDSHLKPFLQAAREMAIEPNGIQLTWDSSGSRWRYAVAGQALLASTRAQLDHLLLLFALSSRFDPQPSFNLCLATTFALARHRSIDHHPLVENQAAILALGMLLGHPRIETFIGPVLADVDRSAAERTMGRVVLRGRPDWTRHFCVCAATTVLSQEAISDGLGLLKEELDADAGGTGFSFGDLLADRAGAAFASWATRDVEAARTMQDRLADGFSIEEVFPPADDLPEGIPDAELQSRYGGVEGAGYRGLRNEIERRVADCAAYRGRQ